MSINWNKEIKMKDVKKFFNQELDTNVDINKVAQTVAMIAIFGIMPAFTYGTVLNSLEEERAALLGEVSSLRQQAAVITSLSYASVSTDKDSYFYGNNIFINYSPAFVATTSTTTNVKVDLYDATGKYVTNISGSNKAYIGQNNYYYAIPKLGFGTTTSAESFVIRVTDLSTGKYVELVRPISIVSGASPAFITARLDAINPPSRVVMTSVSTTTKDVVLGVFDIKSASSSAVLNTLTFTLQNNKNVPLAKIYKNLRIYDEANRVLGTSATSSFSNIRINLPAGEWKTVVLKADIANQNDFPQGTVVSTSLVILGKQPVYANDIKFTSVGVSVTNTSSSYEIIDNRYGAPVSASVKMGFTFNNTGTNDVYVSKLPGVAFATSSTLKPAASSSLTIIATTPSTDPGDTATVYRIPGGASRVFDVYGIINNKNGIRGLQEFKITNIYFSDDKINLQKSKIDSGIEALRVTPVI